MGSLKLVVWSRGGADFPLISEVDLISSILALKPLLSSGSATSFLTS